MNISLYFSLLLFIPIIFLYILFFKKKYVFFAIATCFFIFLTSYSFIYIKNYKDDSFSTMDNLVVVAKVESIKRVSGNYAYVTARDGKLTTEDGKTYNLSGKVSIRLSGKNETLSFNLYDIVSFEANRINGIASIKEDGTFNSYYVSNNVKYILDLTVDDIVSLKYSPDFAEKFKEYNRELLVEHFGERMGHLALTSLYADKNYIEEEIVAQFRESGVAHIFSVSGLHISILAIVINFLLEKFKVGKRLSLVVTAIFLLFYCFLCKFNSPVVRSTIMTLVGLVCKIYMRKYDVLNSISLSGCILLIINPLYAFEIGFQMTFFAVFGIICFSNIFRFIKVKGAFWGKVKASLVSSLSAQLGLLPISMKYFGSVFLWTTFANMLIIPLFTVFYIVLFAINIFVLIVPALGVLYFVPRAMLYAIVYLNKLFISLPFGFIPLPNLSDMLTFIYYVNMFLVSKYVVLGLSAKQLSSYALASIIVIGLMVANYPRRSDGDVVQFIPSTTISTIANVNKNQFYLLCPNTSYTRALYNEMINYRVYQTKFIVLLNVEEKLYASDLEYLSYISPTIVMPKYYEANIKGDNSSINFVFANDQEKFSIGNGFLIKYFYYENVPQFMLVERGTNRLLFVEGSLTRGAQLDNFLREKFNFEINVVRIFNQYESDLSYWSTILNADNFIFDYGNKALTYSI